MRWPTFFWMRSRNHGGAGEARPGSSVAGRFVKLAAKSCAVSRPPIAKVMRVGWKSGETGSSVACRRLWRLRRREHRGWPKRLTRFGPKRGASGVGCTRGRICSRKCLRKPGRRLKPWGSIGGMPPRWPKRSGAAKGLVCASSGIFLPPVEVCWMMLRPVSILSTSPNAINKMAVPPIWRSGRLKRNAGAPRSCRTCGTREV